MKKLIEKYGLSPHPEGGYFREIYRADLKINSPAVQDVRHAATHIYFLLTQGQVSRFHRVAHDELWHFYQGDALKLVLFDGTDTRTLSIGPGMDFMGLVPAMTWQAAETSGKYSLVGCTVTPGFDFKDFSFLSDAPEDLKKFQRRCKSFERYL